MTRLERLLELRAKVDLAILDEQARRRRITREALIAARAEARQRPDAGTGWRAAHATTAEILEQLGVTAHDIKVWAVENGLADEVKRGRVRLEHVDAYHHAHTWGTT